MTRKLNFPRLSVKVLSALFVLVAFAASATTAFAVGSTSLVISQVYGGGGNSGATWQNDYVEIFNRSASAVSLNGLSLQYASAATTGTASGLIPLPNVSMPAGGYYLIQLASQAAVGIVNPVTPDLNNTTTQGVNMSGTGGRVYIVNGTTALSGASLCSSTSIIDFIGFGTTPTCAEGSPLGTAPVPTAAPAPSVTTFDLRGGAGCNDTDVNSADFTVATLGSPSPHNSSSPVNVCGSTPTPTIPSGVGSASPNSVAQGGTTTLSVVVTPGANPTSTGVAVTVNLTAFGGSATQAMTLSGTANTYTYTLAVSSSQTVNSAYTINATITDTQGDSVPVVPISLAVTAPSSGATSGVVISQIYGGGGTTNPDWVELFNPTTGPITLTGYSIQYISAAGTAPNATFGINPLATFTVPAGGYYLIALGGSATLTPAPDQTFSVVDTNLSGTAGKVYLVASTTGLTSSNDCALPTGGDWVSYGTTVNCANGSPTGATSSAPSPTATGSITRNNNGCTNTNVNSADFTMQTTFAPRNSSTAVNLCSGGGTTAATTTTTATANPTSPGVNVSTTLTATVTASSGTPTSGTTVTFFDGLTTLGTGALSTVGGAQVATFTVTAGFSTSGNHAITAVFPAITGFATSTGSLTLNVAAAAATSGVVISQIYGGGGTTNPDWVELFNPTTGPVTLTGYSIQYISAAGTAPNATFGINPLATFTVPAGGYYLVALGGSATLSPAPDQTFSVVDTNLSGTAGKVYLVASTTGLTSSNDCALPTGGDWVSYGTTVNCANGSPAAATASAPSPTATGSITRNNNGCTNTNVNSADFTMQTTFAPRNSATAVNLCSGGGGGTTTVATASGVAVPNAQSVGGSTVLTVTVVPGTNPSTFTSGTAGMSVTANLTAFGGLATQPLTLSSTANVYTYTLTIPINQAATTYNIAFTVKDTPDGTLSCSTCTIALSVNELTSSVNLTAAPTAPVPNQQTVLTATISPSAATGTVVFKDNGTVIGTTGTVTSGVATTTITGGFAAGTHPLTAVYSGDSTYATSTGSLSLPVVAPVAPDFSLGLSNIQVILSGTVPQATTSVNITAVGGLSSAISLACSGLPSSASCVFSPQTVTPNSGINGAFVASTLTVSIDSAANVKPHFGKTSGMALAFTLLAVPFALRRRKGLGRLLALLVMLVAGAQFLSGCGNGGTPASTSTVTVTATAVSGQVHTATITVTAQ